MRIDRIAIGLGVLGVVAMIPFDWWFTRVIGVAGLIGFVVAGVFAIARPEFLAVDSATEDRPADDAVRRLTQPPRGTE